MNTNTFVKVFLTKGLHTKNNTASANRKHQDECIKPTS